MMSTPGRWLPFLLVLPLLLVPTTSRARDLTFAERVRAQEAIERVYYSHQLGTTKPFEEALPRQLLERKVRLYLAQSAALDELWGRRLTAVELQAELQRMAHGTRMPERLLELYTALHHDSVLIHECLARPALASRLVRDFFAHDARLHAAADLPQASFDEWWLDVEAGMSADSVQTVAEEDAPIPAPQVPGPAWSPDEASLCVPDDAWDTGSSGPQSNTPSGRSGHSAVWTGSLMVVWGGRNDSEYFNTGGRYDPATDTWTRTTTAAAPSPRYSHLAVWTGELMVVWGGIRTTTEGPGASAGFRYDPATDSWTPVSPGGPPTYWQNEGHQTAVWSGSRVLIWGEYNGALSGGQYDPASDSWTAISTVGAPPATYRHTAVWTGTRMVVWGGATSSGLVQSGGIYDPVANAWQLTNLTGAPSARFGHTAVWTGQRMIVWGGSGSGGPLNTGGRFNPSTNSWDHNPTSNSGAPTPRSGHSAVWTGSRMVVWGGGGDTVGTSVNTGGLYNPASNSWAPTSTSDAPSARAGHTAVWTGAEMIVWGSGSLNTGGRYDPAQDAWTATGIDVPPGSAPAARSLHSAVWTGTHMLVWGGVQVDPGTGGRYDPATDTWTPTSTLGAPQIYLAPAVWTGNVMVVWGPAANLAAAGGRYDPLADTWAPVATAGAPSARTNQTAIWSGDRMIVWGGAVAGTDPAPLALSTGGRYDPTTDTWSPTSTSGAPHARLDHTAVWTGQRMIVWGGYYLNGIPPHTVFLGDGMSYDPTANVWSSISATGPYRRFGHTAVWTGSEMVVWGGVSDSCCPSTLPGGRYDPIANVWTPTTTTGAPAGRFSHTAIWTGSRMLVWGGRLFPPSSNEDTDTGGAYDPLADSWALTALDGAPESRYGHSAVWTGSQMIVWGGSRIGGGPLSTGGRYALLAIDDDLDGLSECGGDCNDGDPTLRLAPSEVTGLAVAGGSPTFLHFDSQDAASGSATRYELISGDLASLLASGGYEMASCLGSFSDEPAVDAAGAPPPGAGRYYLVRARNDCPAGGAGTFGDSSIVPDPRDELDVSSPCP